MKTREVIICLLVFLTAFSACRKDNQKHDSASPTIQNIEVGINNKEMAVIGQDFHFNADIIAGDKIENVSVNILPRPDEIYSKAWKHEIIWDQYKGAKNTTVHKHFDIPAEAAEGKYDFLIIVNDQNGTRLEVRKALLLYHQ